MKIEPKYFYNGMKANVVLDFKMKNAGSEAITSDNTKLL